MARYDELVHISDDEKGRFVIRPGHNGYLLADNGHQKIGPFREVASAKMVAELLAEG